MRVTKLLSLSAEDMGEDWGIILADVALIASAIKIIGANKEPWMVRAAIGCILVESLFDLKRCEGVVHCLYPSAYSALHGDLEVLSAVRNFWIGGGVRGLYIRDL